MVRRAAGQVGAPGKERPCGASARRFAGPARARNGGSPSLRGDRQGPPAPACCALAPPNRRRSPAVGKRADARRMDRIRRLSAGQDESRRISPGMRKRRPMKPWVERRLAGDAGSRLPARRPAACSAARRAARDGRIVRSRRRRARDARRAGHAVASPDGRVAPEADRESLRSRSAFGGRRDLSGSRAGTWPLAGQGSVPGGRGCDRQPDWNPYGFGFLVTTGAEAVLDRGGRMSNIPPQDVRVRTPAKSLAGQLLAGFRQEAAPPWLRKRRRHPCPVSA